jgi:MAP3K TRAFs-binding domain
MEQLDPVDPRQAELLPVIRFAVGQRLKSKAPDYWDRATVLELAVLARDKAGANKSLPDALAATREPWEPQTTARNLRLIREARARRNEDTDWIKTIEDKLVTKATTLAQTRA